MLQYFDEYIDWINAAFSGVVTAASFHHTWHWQSQPLALHTDDSIGRGRVLSYLVNYSYSPWQPSWQLGHDQITSPEIPEKTNPGQPDHHYMDLQAESARIPPPPSGPPARPQPYHVAPHSTAVRCGRDEGLTCLILDVLRCYGHVGVVVVQQFVSAPRDSRHTLLTLALFFTLHTFRDIPTRT